MAVFAGEGEKEEKGGEGEGEGIRSRTKVSNECIEPLPSVIDYELKMK